MPTGRQAQDRLLYRARQFLAALRPWVDGAEREEAAGALGEGLLPLFESMGRRDQQHCLDVYRALRASGCRDGEVLTAALLHDAGKGRLAGARVRLGHRVAYVVLAAVAPRLLKRLARGGGLAALHGHAELGAELAAARGAPGAVVELIRRHEAPDAADERLRSLQAADDSC